ncbi:MAG: GNAT family N-acetyltransferase [Candidatus Gracilibacteria bacterium]
MNDVVSISNLTQSINFQELTAQDAEVLVSLYSKDIVQNFEFLQKCPTLEEERIYIERMRNSSTDVLRGIYFEEKLIGTIGLHEINDEDKSARLGVIIWDKNFHKKGIASYSIKSIADFAFSEASLEKLYANILFNNTRADKFYRKLGFRAEHILERYYSLRGKEEDMIHMVLKRH